ncbi:hypothetical protein [Streptomyces sp. NPDC002769]|uniref:hypothetical protein n=1 Tax=Streptomyces sp. NPDC002769 TaxID=3154542 RepID=UPI00331C2EF9
MTGTERTARPAARASAAHAGNSPSRGTSINASTGPGAGTRTDTGPGVGTGAGAGAGLSLVPIAAARRVMPGRGA